MLERLDGVEVRSFTLREAVLSVELEFGCDNRVLSPAVKAEGGLGENERTGVRDERVDVRAEWVVKVAVLHVVLRRWPRGCRGADFVKDLRTRVSEQIASVDDSVSGAGSAWSRVSVLGAWDGVNAIGVVEWLGTEDVVKERVAKERRAVINKGVFLDDENDLLARVVEIELDFVGGRSDGFITSELKLLNEVFVWVLCHAAAFVGVKEDVVNVERRSDKRFRVSVGGLAAGSARACGTFKESGIADSPQDFVKGTNLEVNLNFVILKGNEGKSQTRVAAEPELEWDVEGCFWEGITGGTCVARGTSGASLLDISETWVCQVGKLRCVSNHFVVSCLLLGCGGKLVPDVHPVTILFINALPTNFYFNVVNEVMSGVVKPACEISIALVNFRKSYLEVCSVSQITIAGNGALDPATKVAASIESLFNGFHSKVGVSAVCYLEKCDLWVSCKIDVLSAVSYELH
jgi:hypothetical protein